MPSITVNLPLWMHRHLKERFGNKSKTCREAIKKFQDLLEVKLPKWLWDYGDRNREIATMSMNQETIDYMDGLKDERRFFSRSEFLRMAIFLFILKDLDGRKTIMDLDKVKDLEENMVRVPIDLPDEKGNHNEFKEYRIVRRLEY